MVHRIRIQHLVCCDCLFNLSLNFTYSLPFLMKQFFWCGITENYSYCPCCSWLVLGLFGVPVLGVGVVVSWCSCCSVVDHIVTATMKFLCWLGLLVGPIKLPESGIRFVSAWVLPSCCHHDISLVLWAIGRWPCQTDGLVKILWSIFLVIITWMEGCFSFVLHVPSCCLALQAGAFTQRVHAAAPALQRLASWAMDPPWGVVVLRKIVPVTPPCNIVKNTSLMLWLGTEDLYFICVIQYIVSV